MVDTRVGVVGGVAALMLAAVTHQAVDRSISSPTCRQCWVILQPVASLTAPEISSLPSAVGRDGSGNFVLGFADGKTPPLLFDPSGRYVGPLARRGAGPGEFGDVAQIRRRGNGGLLVLDRGNGRLAFQGTNGRWSSVPVPTNAFDAIELSGGRFVVNASIPTRDAIAKPLVLLAVDGEVVRHFGEDAGRTVLPSTRARSFLRKLVTTGPTSYWAVDAAFRYRAVEWTDDRRGVTLRRRVDWMPDREVPYTPVTPDIPPQPVIAAVGTVDDSLLVVIAAISDPRWARGLDRVTGSGAAGQYDRVTAAEYRVGRPAEVFDTQLEVFDFRRQNLIATRRVDQAIGYALGDGFVAGVQVDDDGEYVVSIYRVGVRQP